jgi:LacI family transcriptional regulator
LIVFNQNTEYDSILLHEGNETLPKHRIYDIAHLAGVGTATVDRVLNERGGVSRKSVEKVLAAARRLKLKRILPTSHRRVLRIEVLLARPELPLVARMKHEFGRLSERMDRSVIIERTILKTDDPRLVAKAIRQTTADGLIFYPHEDPHIYDAIAQAQARGVQVVTILSDVPDSERLACAGTDHFEAGRTAGFFMAQMARSAGQIAILCHNQKIYGHAKRIAGFCDALSRHGKHLNVAKIIEGDDDSRKSETQLLKAFKQHDDIVGIYNVGAANDAVGIAIDRKLLRSRPIFIGHELTPESRVLLQSGVMTLVIDQNPEHQSRFAIDVLLHHFGYTDQTWLTKPYRSNIAFKLHTVENMTEFTTPQLIRQVSAD